ncbi:MAG: pantoate--beta-alanine ligase [Anaerolineae bacterium]
MIVTANINEVRTIHRQDSEKSWGFVPTMGYLHEGHLSLVRRAREENGRVAVSIYVNPTQFAPTEDLASYPRDLDRDLALLEAENVDLVFTPSDEIMYPPGFQTTVLLSEVTKPLEGASRPTHFAGVATVVAKLFNIVQPNRAYFGQKDAQQTVVLRQMVRDLNFNLEMIICPIVRESDGLAMSSRNKYLSPAERQAALVLNRALKQARTAFEKGERDANTLRRIMTDLIAAEPLARLDYISTADPNTLAELETIEHNALLSMAVFIGSTRLIDNLVIKK